MREASVAQSQRHAAKVCESLQMRVLFLATTQVPAIDIFLVEPVALSLDPGSVPDRRPRRVCRALTTRQGRDRTTLLVVEFEVEDVEVRGAVGV